MNNFPTTLILTIIALAVVLVVAWLLLRGLKSMGVAQNRNGRIKIIESVPLGSRERIVLVRLDAKEYLIGVSAGGLVQIQTAVSEQPGSPDPMLSDQPAARVTPN